MTKEPLAATPTDQVEQIKNSIAENKKKRDVVIGQIKNLENNKVKIQAEYANNLVGLFKMTAMDIWSKSIPASLDPINALEYADKFVTAYIKYQQDNKLAEKYGSTIPPIQSLEDNIARLQHDVEIMNKIEQELLPHLDCAIDSVNKANEEVIKADTDSNNIIECSRKCCNK